MAIRKVRKITRPELLELAGIIGDAVNTDPLSIPEVEEVLRGISRHGFNLEDLRGDRVEP